MTVDQDPEALIRGFSEKLRSQWEQHRRQSFNPNTKGAAFENTLKRFLLDYYRGIYHIRTRTAVIDRYLECFEVFNAGENEFDVVASFRQAIPELVLESGEMKWVTYEGVAFVCEVKSELNATALKSDLKKFAKLKSLDQENPKDRFPTRYGGTQISIEPEKGVKEGSRQATVEHQLKCLIYDKSSISHSTLMQVLHTDTEIWDLLLVVDENVLFVSSELPFADIWFERIGLGSPDSEHTHDMSAISLAPCLQDGLIWFILLLAISIPHPPPFDVSAALVNLVQRNWNEHGGYFGFGSLR